MNSPYVSDYRSGLLCLLQNPRFRMFRNVGFPNGYMWLRRGFCKCHINL